MSLRDYEGWRRYGEWKKQNYENYQKQMSDREIMDSKHGYTSYKKVPVTNLEQTLGLMPDQKWHRRVSFIKSGIRIAGYALIPFNLIAATVVLVISEVVGIVEELV